MKIYHKNNLLAMELEPASIFVVRSKVICEVEWINKKTADFRFHGSKSGPVFILKEVHSLAFDTMLLNKSSFIFPMK